VEVCLIVDEVKSFIEAIWAGAKPKVDAADANYAVQAVEKAYESIRLAGRLDVRLIRAWIYRINADFEFLKRRPGEQETR